MSRQHLRITKDKLGTSVFENHQGQVGQFHIPYGYSPLAMLHLQSWAALCHTALENIAYIGYGCCLHVALWVGLNLRVLWWGVGASNTIGQKQATQKCGRGAPGKLLWASGETTMTQLLQRLLGKNDLLSLATGDDRKVAVRRDMQR